MKSAAEAPVPTIAGVTLGRAIRSRRLDVGLTLAKLAKAIGVSPSFIHDIEADRRGTTKLNEIEDALALPEGYLWSYCRKCPTCGQATGRLSVTSRGGK